MSESSKNMKKWRVFRMRNNTKQEIVNYLEGNVKNIKGDIKDMLVYNLKAYEERPTDITKAELLDLVEDVKGALPLPIEMSNKPKGEDIKPVIEKADTKVEDEVVPKVELKMKDSSKDSKPKEIIKKADTPKEDKPKEAKPVEKEKKTLESVSANILASEFPKTIEAGEYTLDINMEINSFDDIVKYQKEMKPIVIALYWSERLLKQFHYDTLEILDYKVEKFPQDLDIAQPVFISEGNTVMYVVSTSTDGMYAIKPEQLEVYEGKLRLSAGMEYNIYTSETPMVEDVK